MSASLPSDLAVVKVGGSLLDLPGLGPALQEWSAGLAARSVILVPGGGATADVIRELDRVHALGDTKAHWLALRALTLNAHLLAALLPNSPVIESPNEFTSRVAVIDPHAFCSMDERDDAGRTLAHSWSVTSDSIAAKIAVATQAQELILLKSVSIPTGVGWTEASRCGFVDQAFAATIESAPNLRVRAINFRKLIG
jgi:aspartokinase-like uncharacterized kinase